MDFLANAMISLTQKSDYEKGYHQIIKDNGYPCEKHYYETADGYINLVVRISGKITLLII